MNQEPTSRFDEILKATYNTVWKLNNFPITQILREIMVGESKALKSAI